MTMKGDFIPLNLTFRPLLVGSSSCPYYNCRTMIQGFLFRIGAIRAQCLKRWHHFSWIRIFPSFPREVCQRSVHIHWTYKNTTISQSLIFFYFLFLFRLTNNRDKRNIGREIGLDKNRLSNHVCSFLELTTSRILNSGYFLDQDISFFF
jgi:hypothetical protein